MLVGLVLTDNGWLTIAGIGRNGRGTTTVDIGWIVIGNGMTVLSPRTYVLLQVLAHVSNHIHARESPQQLCRLEAWQQFQGEIAIPDADRGEELIPAIVADLEVKKNQMHGGKTTRERWRVSDDAKASDMLDYIFARFTGSRTTSGMRASSFPRNDHSKLYTNLGNWSSQPHTSAPL